MKHTWKITLIIIAMFLVTQLIGLAVIKTYTTGWQVSKKTIVDGVPQEVSTTFSKDIPYGLEPPEVQPKVSLISIILAIIVATVVLLLLSRIKANMFLRLWFAFVVLITVAISISTLLHQYIALAIAAVLTYFKVWRRDVVVHNLTELIIYPGLASIFVPILSIGVTILLLILLSFYDFYAVYKSKHMIKLAKFQMEELKVFTGFFIPYVSGKDREKLKKLRMQQKLMKGKVKEGKEGKFKVNVAILGGGDVAFPLIFAGVILKTLGTPAALIISVFSTLGLAYLLVTAQKGKFYPAMPFLTVATLIGYAIVAVLYGTGL